jgi:bifunctional non-homologous end joining protein LigD
VIPEGYGAGIVMLWDQGTWQPEVDDVAAALRKGDLKFRLNGVKLKGSWVLVRTRGSDGRSWLLIKHRDEWSGPVDITEFAPLSVKSEGDFADILAADRPEIWLSNRPAQGGDAGAMFAKIVERALALRKTAPTVAARKASKAPGRPAGARRSAKAAPRRSTKKAARPVSRRKGR